MRHCTISALLKFESKVSNALLNFCHCSQNQLFGVGSANDLDIEWHTSCSLCSLLSPSVNEIFLKAGVRGFKGRLVGLALERYL
jgi:hypothetical protein